MVGWIIVIATVGLVIYYAGIEVALWSGLMLGVAALVFGGLLRGFLRLTDSPPIGRREKSRRRSGSTAPSPDSSVSAPRAHLARAVLHPDNRRPGYT